MRSQKKDRIYSRYTFDAAVLLGKHIQFGRKERNLAEHDLAERLGISRTTLRKIEKGDLKCEVGLVLEAAAIVGVSLFEVDSVGGSFSKSIKHADDKIALLPKRVRKKSDLDDAF